MRSLFTFLFLALFTFSYAQDLSLNVNDVQLELDGYIEYGDVLLTNSGSDTLEIAVRLERKCYDADDITKIQICIGVLCFFPEDNDKTWGVEGDAILKLAPNTPSDALKFQPGPIGDMGSEWSVVFFDRNNPDNNVTLDVTIGECLASSTNNIVHTVGAAFPNPAKDFINISYVHDADDAQLLIFNSVGIQMESITLDQLNGQVEVNTQNYSSGVYFYYVVDQKGGQSQMLSFVK